MRVTVRREASESGLARVFQSHRGFVISVDGQVAARVGWSHAPDKSKPWHWYGGNPFRNTAAEGTFFATKEDARDDAVAYVKSANPVPKMTPSPQVTQPKGDE